jgi:arylformamidase
MPAILDISAPLGAGAVAYPGDPPFRRESVAASPAVSALSMSAHAGTHLDFPAHVIPGGKGVADYPPDAFFLPAVVVAVPEDAPAVTHEDVLRAGLEPGDAVLFRTGNSRSGVCVRGEWTDRFVAMTPEAARACVGAEARLAGIDAMSVDRAADADLPVHRILLGNGVLVLEGLDLSGVAPGRYTLSCLPLRIPGCEASPVRAVLLRDFPTDCDAPPRTGIVTGG